jgi:hypothetical protein
MTSSQRFGRFAIPFRVPLLFSSRMARVTAAETSSKEWKRFPRMSSFNLWNKSKFGGLVSGLYGAWGNTSHSYLLSKSVTTFLRCGRALSCPSPSKSGRFLYIFLRSFASSHDSTLLSHLFHTELCHDDSSVIISKDHHLLDLWLRSSEFCGSRGGWTSPLVWLRFQLQFKVSNPRFDNNDNSIQECLTFKIKPLFQ